jgi:hypothetical protein
MHLLYRKMYRIYSRFGDLSIGFSWLSILSNAQFILSLSKGEMERVSKDAAPTYPSCPISTNRVIIKLIFVASPFVTVTRKVILYRPVGLKELDLITRADFRAFPPRLAHQPFFYPVLNFEYAQQIARDWNTKDEASGFAGFITSFEVEDSVCEAV